MSRVHRIELLCEIDPQRESIHGEMSDRKGKTLPFTGWTEFAGALVSLTRDGSEGHAKDDSAPKPTNDRSSEQK